MRRRQWNILLGLVFLTFAPVIALGAYPAIFESGFESGDLTGWTWDANNSNEPCASTDYAKAGSYSMKSHLTSEMDPNNRTEAYTAWGTYPVFVGCTYRYEFSLYLPADYNTSSVWEIVAQWHGCPDWTLGECSRQPCLSLLTTNGVWSFETRWDSKVNTCPAGTPVYEGSATLSLGAYTKEVWTDWVVEVHWDYDEDGWLKIWKDDELVVDRPNQANCFNDRKGPYFKWGLYTGWDSLGCAEICERTIYGDAFSMTGTTAYFVAPDGNDADAGTRAEPWRTPDRALKDWGGGGTIPARPSVICFRAGDYNGIDVDYVPSAYDDEAGVDFNETWDWAFQFRDYNDEIADFNFITVESSLCDRYMEFRGLRVIDDTNGTQAILVQLRDCNYVKVIDCNIIGNTNVTCRADVTGQSISANSSQAFREFSNLIIEDCNISYCELGPRITGLTSGGQANSCTHGDGISISHNHIWHINGTGISVGMSLPNSSGTAAMQIEGNVIECEYPLLQWQRLTGSWTVGFTANEEVTQAGSGASGTYSTMSFVELDGTIDDPNFTYGDAVEQAGTGATGRFYATVDGDTIRILPDSSQAVFEASGVITNEEGGEGDTGQFTPSAIVENYLYIYVDSATMFLPSGTITGDDESGSFAPDSIDANDWTHASGVSVRADDVNVIGNTIRALGSTSGIMTYPPQTGSDADTNGWHGIRVENNLIYDSGAVYCLRLEYLGHHIACNNNTAIGYHLTPWEERTASIYGTQLRLLPKSGLSDEQMHNIEMYNNIIVGIVNIYYNGLAFDINDVNEDGNVFWACNKIDEAGYLPPGVGRLKGESTIILADLTTLPDDFETGFFEDPNYGRGSNTLVWGSDGGPHFEECDYSLSVTADANGQTVLDLCSLTKGASTDIEGNARVDISGVGNDGEDYGDPGAFEYQTDFGAKYFFARLRKELWFESIYSL